MYGPPDFDSICHLVSKVSAYERSHLEVLQERQRRSIGCIQAKEDDTLDDTDAYLVQWAKTNKPLQCQRVKQPEPIPGYDFDVSKTEAIFDMLDKEKLLVPLPRHQTPTSEEMSGRKYCKWHNKLDGHKYR